MTSGTDQPTELRGGLDRVLNAGSAVVVGASDRRGVHVAAIQNLLAGGSDVWGLHPRRTEVLGLECFPSADSLPGVPDVAIVLVGRDHVVGAVEEVLEAGARSLVVPGLGNEAGADKRGTIAEVAALAEGHGVPLVGVNCMGLAVPGGLSPWVGTLGRELRRGGVGAVVQSGSAGEALAALGPRVGFRCIASVGAETSRDVADWLGELAEDEETTAVAVFLESVRRPAALKSALERLAEVGKPVVCLRVGRSSAGARATVAHTEAILTPARAFAALSRHVGLIEANDFEEMVETLELLGRGMRRPRGVRIAAVTQSGGEAALLADLAEEVGAETPEFDSRTRRELSAVLPPGTPVGNPLDAWAIDDTKDVYRSVFEVLFRAGKFDVVLVQLDQTPFVGEMEARVSELISQALIDASQEGAAAPVILSGQASEPVESVLALGIENEVPLLRGARPALAALTAVGGWKPWEWPPPPPEFVPEPLDLPAGDLGEVEAGTILAPFGIEFSAVERVRSLAEAESVAHRLGYPVVLKADEASHRSLGGRVVADLGTWRELRKALALIPPPALICEQVKAGPEVYCGAHHHAGYGPIVCIGWGGHLVEQSAAVACALAPIEHEDARGLLSEVPGLSRAISSRLRGELAQLLVGFSRMAASLPVGSSVDINPVILNEERGAVAVDALITQTERELRP